MKPDAYAPPVTSSIPPGNLSRAQAAARLGVSVTWFDALVRRGDLTKRGNTHTRTVWFDEREVDKLVQLRAQDEHSAR